MNKLKKVTQDHFINALEALEYVPEGQITGPIVKTHWFYKNRPLLLQVDQPDGTTDYFAVSNSSKS